ncbi:MAG: Plug domain-containing protein [Bacteroidales bacterium]|nr:Plug domain-containing protein [Bacteroidales bacterium]
MVFHLKPELQTLNEVIISESYQDLRKKDDPRSVDVVNQQYIRSNMSGSLMKSLEKIPGVHAMEIGSGQSKPIIRGLGFNQVVVLENGIKHEGQQWGEDHGLEIDQFASDRIEVIKGPASLMYGSDAIAGIIDIKRAKYPQRILLAVLLT